MPVLHMFVDERDYEQAVARHHEDLYRFALSLSRNRDDALDLTQESYFRLLQKGDQLRDRSKVKSWLFTTLYRLFLGRRRHEQTFHHTELSHVEGELPALTPDVANQLDAGLVTDTLQRLDEIHRVPLVLFYLQCLSYREIAQMLDVPVGTVMSRLARAKAALRGLLLSGSAAEVTPGKVIPLADNHRNLRSSRS